MAGPCLAKRELPLFLKVSLIVFTLKPVTSSQALSSNAVTPGGYSLGILGEHSSV